MKAIKKPRIAPGLSESKTTYLRRRKSSSERPPKPANASVLGSGIFGSKYNCVARLFIGSPLSVAVALNNVAPTAGATFGTI